MRKLSLTTSILLIPVLLALFGQGCTRSLEFSKMNENPVHMAASGNGEPYDGKLRILHHYVDNFTCEGRPQPESILIREGEAEWYLIRNTSDKCAFIDRDPVQDVQYDEVVNQAIYNNELYVPPHPYYVDANEDPNLSDVRLEDGVCEDQNGICSLKAAIDQTGPTSMTEAVLVHIPAGTYVVTTPIVLTTQSQDGKAITIRGADPLTTILDGSGLVIPLKIIIDNTALVSVENLTIQNGKGFGGGNVGYWDPGIFSTRGGDQVGMQLTVANCIFKNNKGNAGVSGGPGSQIRISKSQFLSNQFNTAVTVSRVSSLLIEDTTISNGTGFGIWTYASKHVVIRRSTLFKFVNQGISLDDCHSCLLENVTVAQSQQTGVTIFASRSDPSFDVTINNSTLVGNGTNNSMIAGNIQVEFFDSKNKLILNNSILSVNNASKKNCIWGDTYSHAIIATNSIFDDSSCQQLGSGNILTDPQLAPLADNGGWTQTMLPFPGSPAIDAGANQLCSAEDQRGLQRPRLQNTGPRCDIGAVELQ